MTSTSMAMVLAPKVIGRVVKIPYGEKDCPSNTVRMVGDGVMGGQPRACQHEKDITEMSSPSSTTIQ